MGRVSVRVDIWSGTKALISTKTPGRAQTRAKLLLYDSIRLVIISNEFLLCRIANL